MQNVRRQKVLVPIPGDRIEEYAVLEQAGHRVVYGRPLGDRRPFTDPELAELCADADGVISMGISGPPMISASRLRAVIAPIIGLDRLDLKTATKQGIVVCNSPAPENFKGVGASIVGLIFMLG